MSHLVQPLDNRPLISFYDEFVFTGVRLGVLDQRVRDALSMNLFTQNNLQWYHPPFTLPDTVDNYLALYRNWYNSQSIQSPCILEITHLERHALILGGTGAGKSELVKRIIDGIQQPFFSRPMIIIDPHAKLARESALSQMDCQHSDRIVYIDTSLKEGHTPTINPLDHEYIDARSLNKAAKSLINVFADTFGSVMTDKMKRIIEPYISILLLTKEATLNDLVFHLSPENDGSVKTKAFIKKGRSELQKVQIDSLERSISNKGDDSTRGLLVDKIEGLLFNPSFDDLFNNKSTLSLDDAISNNKIIYFSVDNSPEIGRMLVAIIHNKFLAKLDNGFNRTYLVVDEAHNYESSTFSALISESRKYNLSSILITQHLNKFKRRDIKDALKGIGLKFIGTNTSGKDAERIEKIVGNIDSREFAIDQSPIPLKFRCDANKDFSRTELPDLFIEQQLGAYYVRSIEETKNKEVKTVELDNVHKAILEILREGELTINEIIDSKATTASKSTIQRKLDDLCEMEKVDKKEHGSDEKGRKLPNTYALLNSIALSSVDLIYEKYR